MSTKAKIWLEEFYLSNYRSQHNCMDRLNRKIQQFDFYDVVDFAEAYAKHVVESVSEYIPEEVLSQMEIMNEINP